MVKILDKITSMQYYLTMKGGDAGGRKSNEAPENHHPDTSSYSSHSSNPRQDT
jgi:hypothetical protein